MDRAYESWVIHINISLGYTRVVYGLPEYLIQNMQWIIIHFWRQKWLSEGIN